MFDNPNYIPPSPTSPITPLDAFVMADLVQGTIAETDPAIAAEIAEYIVLHDISGADFLDLSKTYLRRLSKDNDQVFKKLKELQNARISLDAIPSSSTPSLSSTFPELSSSIRLSRILEGSFGGANNTDNAAVIDHHTDVSGSSAIHGTQIPGDPNEDAWDLNDEDDLQTPDLPTAVAEAAVLQDDINLPNHSLHPVSLINPALENGPPSASTSDQAIPITDPHTSTTPTSDGATQVHSAEEARNSVLQPLPSEPINVDDASIYGINESQLVINPLDSHPAGELDGENTHLHNDSVLASLVFSSPPSTRSSSPLSYLSYIDSDDEEDPDAATQLSQMHLDNNVPIPHTTLDHNIPIEHDTLPIISRPSSPSPENLTQVLFDVSQLESLLGRSRGGHPQTTLGPNLNILIEHDGPPIISIPSTLTDSWQITEDEEALEPPCLPASDPTVQTMLDSWNILEEDEKALEPAHLPASEPAVSDTHFDVNEALNGRTYKAPQRSESSNDEPEDTIHEVDSPRCSNTGSMDPRDSFTSNETHESIEFRRSSLQSSPSSSTLPLDSSHDDLYEQYDVDTAPFTLPIDIIPMTPPGSPILEGLSQYMILEAVLGVNQDDVSTTVQHDIPTREHTLQPSSEAPPSGLPSSSGGERSLGSAQRATDPPESPRPNTDVVIAPASDPPYPNLSHVQVRDLHLGRSGRSPSPLEYMQSGILRLWPSFFALRSETIDRAT